MATPSVPGADFTIISYPNTFTNPQNLQIAQAIEDALFSALAGDPLNVAVYSNTPPAAVPGDINELVVPTSLSGGTVSVPAGYSFVADSTGGGAFTVLGAQNFIGGNGSLMVQNTVGAGSVGGGIDSITAGNGADHGRIHVRRGGRQWQRHILRQRQRHDGGRHGEQPVLRRRRWG
jgi:hypothetical protein